MAPADPTRIQFPPPDNAMPIAAVPSPAPHEAEELDDGDVIDDEAHAEGKTGGGLGTLVSWVLLGATGIAFTAFLLAIYVPARTEHSEVLADLDVRSADLDQANTDLEAARADAAAARADADAAKQQNGELEAKSDELAKRVTELEHERDALAQNVASKDAALKLLALAQKKLEASLGDEIKSGDVSIRSRGGELVVGVADRVLFAAGNAELNDRGKKVMKRVAETMSANSDRVFQVAGHTDDDPVTGELATRYPTNWELSAARATNVVRFLQEQCEVPGGQLIAAGFAENRPAASNKTLKSKKKNRRIEITMLVQPRSAAK